MAFFVLTADVVSTILNTMVFVDSFNKRIILTNHLCNLLPTHKKE